MKEKAALNLTRYRDKDGLPTCATNFETGEVCEFWGCKNFGQKEYCRWIPETRLFRRGEDGSGYLIPTDHCPLWRGKV